MPFSSRCMALRAILTIEVGMEFSERGKIVHLTQSVHSTQPTTLSHIPPFALCRQSFRTFPFSSILQSNLHTLTCVLPSRLVSRISCISLHNFDHFSRLLSSHLRYLKNSATET